MELMLSISCSEDIKSRMEAALDFLKYNVWRPLRSAYWWIMHRVHPRHRYHIVKTGLEPNYYDIDTLMLHSMIFLLKRYIVDEHGGVKELEEHIKDLRANPDENMPEFSERTASNDEKALAIWKWWTLDKPADVKREDEILTDLYGSRNGSQTLHYAYDENLSAELMTLEKKISDDEQEMLHQLIDIRQSLWT